MAYRAAGEAGVQAGRFGQAVMFRRAAIVNDELITFQDAVERFSYSPDWLEQQVREGNLPETGRISRQELENLVRESLGTVTKRVFRRSDSDEL